MAKVPRSTDLEPRISRFKLRGSRLVDAEPVLLGWLLDRIDLARGVGRRFGAPPKPKAGEWAKAVARNR